MRRKQLILGSGLITGALVLSFFTSASSMGPRTQEMLSVEQTLGAVLDNRAEGFGYRWNLYARSNPQARLQVLSLLANEEASEYRPAALRVLGYIGHDADAKDIQVTAINRFSGLLDKSQRETLRAYCDCLGLMSGRGSGNAQRILHEMTTMEYWRHTEFSLRRPSTEIGSKPGYEHEHAGLALAFGGAALSKDKALERRAGLALESMDPRIRDYMRDGQIGPAVLSKRLREVAAAEAEPLTPNDRKLLEANYRRQRGLLGYVTQELSILSP